MPLDDLELRISGRRLREALQMVPAAYHQGFVMAMLGLPAQPSAAEPAPAAPSSYPLTAAQARALRLKIDGVTWAIVRKALEHVEDGVARVTWPEVCAVAQPANWETFAKGRLGGLHRALRNIVGDDRAILFWSAETDEAQGGGAEPQALAIDGPAVEALQAARQLAFSLRTPPKPAATTNPKAKPASGKRAKP